MKNRKGWFKHSKEHRGAYFKGRRMSGREKIKTVIVSEITILNAKKERIGTIRGKHKIHKTGLAEGILNDGRRVFEAAEGKWYYIADYHR